MPKTKQLPKPINRYYVGEPVVVLTIARYEALLKHLIDLAMLERKPKAQRIAVMETNQAIIEECRDELERAYTYYRIRVNTTPSTLRALDS